jgi:hypothetical protein
MGGVNGSARNIHSRLGEIIPAQGIHVSHEVRGDSVGCIQGHFFIEHRPGYNLLYSRDEKGELLGRIVEGWKFENGVNPTGRFLQIYGFAWAHTSWIEEVARPYIIQWGVEIKTDQNNF